MDRSWSLLALLLLCINSVNCLIPEDEALKDIIEALSTGRVITFCSLNLYLGRKFFTLPKNSGIFAKYVLEHSFTK